MRIVSAPTYDADSDGVRDTFVQGDKILADVEYSEPVSVTGTPRLRLQLGTDGSGPVTGNRKRMDMESELHGGRTLRFAYTVAAADTDTDGVWVETAGTNKTVVFLPGGATIKSANSGFAAGVTWSGLPTTGDANAKVDGAKTSADTGPRPTVATVNGATLEVTFDTALDTSVDTSKLPLYFSVYGTELSGGHRNAYQHPATVAFAAGDTTNTKLVLTLGDPARAGDTVTLNYTLINHTGLLKDADDKEAPAFFDLAVTNNTLGTAGPAPSRASVWARTLQLVFDGDLDEASTPAGSAFLVETSDPDGDRRSIAGTGTATVSGATVTVELDEDEEPVGANDLVRVSYTVPTSNPLQNADGDDVLAFERFRVEEVLDGIAPEFVGGEAMQTSTSPATSKVVIYFDEPLDSSSVPVAGHFTLLMGPPSTSVTPSSVAVEGDAVTLTLNQGIASTITTVSLGYITGSNSIVDLAGNAAAGFTHGMTPTTAATPMLATSGAGAPAVDGASLTLTYDLPLDPAKVPGADRYTLHYQLATGETEADRDEYPRKTAAVAVRSKKIVLRLDAPVYPCDPEPTVSYAQTTGGPNVQGIDGQAAADIEHQVVDNKREATCTTSQGVSGNSGGQGKSVALKFGRTLDTDRTLQASAFRLAGASAPSVTGAAYTADAAGVALTLDRALAPGETVEARYERPVGEPGLWDTAGEQIENFSGVTVTNEEPAAPAVTRVELVSDAGEDDTYGLGDAIRIRLTFSEPVDVTGSPRLKIDMDPEHWGEKWVAYESGDGTDSLTFSHTVVEPNESTQGIAVLANTLQANGGAIRSASAGTDAALGHDGLNHDPAHKVDWRLAPTGTASVTGVEVVSDSGSDDTYALGETIRVRVTFSEAVSATGAPRLRIDMDPAPHWGAKWAVYEGGDGTESLSFAYEVVEPNESTQGIAVLADTLEANGGAIRSVSGGADAHLSHTGLGHDPAHKVDWRLAPGANVPATGAPAIAGTAQVGETLTASTADIEDADGLSGATFAFQWVSIDGGTEADIAGATNTSYTLADSDAGKAVKVRVTFTDDGGTEETLTSAASATVAAQSNVAATGAPAITGDARVGETLTASTADIEDADGLSGATFAFQWVRSADGSDTDIAGATGASYVLADVDVGATIKVRASFTDDAGNGEEVTSAATAQVEPRPLTAEFEGMPAEHDGAHLFNFDLVFSENFPGRFPYTTLRDSAFTVTNGRVRGAERVVKGENRRWRIKVRPSSNDDLTITLAAGAVSTESGRPLANTVSATVAGPVGVSVADARVKEAAGAALAFAVTLSRTATTAFSVDYATSDGTARAGDDYTAASGTLSFQAGDSSKTIEVSVLDDAHDEGEETLTLRLSNASGAWLSDGEATGTIENADLMPAALLARFGRATAEQVVT
ncbi:MAG: SwmB domain-containing protein, partial [Acidobacteria bacterium]|nr:SwmB domain-containing protein [Acidobacteriota bacterium]